MKKQIRIGKVLLNALIPILALVMIYSGLRILESTAFSPAVDETAPEKKTIVRDGIEYFPRQDMTTFLVMGIDQEGIAQDSGSYNNPGTADVVFLVVFDESKREYHIITLNRDMMVEMPILGIGGKPAGTTIAQLGLAHTYGNGLEESCENVRTTVSSLLYGIDITHYMSIRMSAMATLNDAVGGVKVTVTDDFSQVDPSIETGEITLQGEQALNFLRARKDVGDQLNSSRMVRHEAYMKGFAQAMQEIAAIDPNFAENTFSKISDYLVADCASSTLYELVNRFSEYRLSEVISPSGVSRIEEGYMEFHVDEEALDALIVRLLYAPK